MFVEHLNQLGEVPERAGQPIDLIDDDHVDTSGLNIGEQFLQPIHRTTGIATVVVVIAEQAPTLMCLTLDVGLRSFPLGVEGVEVLFEPLVRRDPRIDRAAETAFSRLIRHGGAFPDTASCAALSATSP